MSEKRFYIHCADNINKQLIDTEFDFNIHIEEVGGDEELLIQLCDCLNEQQATISKQLDQIIELQDKYRILEFNRSRLEKRNKAQYEKIDEQQTIINKLKEENKQLKEEIEPLKQKEEVLNEIWRNYLETHKYGRFIMEDYD